EESRRAAGRTESANWRIDAGGNGALGAREEFVVAAHELRLDEKAIAGKTLAIARAAASTSGASNTPVITASSVAPVRTSTGALAAVIPPIATTGTRSARACSRSATSARRASGLTDDGKKLPNAT